MEWLTEHTFARRLVSVPAYFLFTLVMIVTSPIWLPGCWLLGHVRPSLRSAMNCLIFISLYLICGSIGIIGTFYLWLRHGLRESQHQRFLLANRALQYWWADSLRRGAEKIFRLRFVEEGIEALNGPGAIMLPRHTSIGDTILPMAFYAIPKALEVSYVFKRELLIEPCLDIVGNRLPNVFLNRVAEDMGPELGALQNLAKATSHDNAVLVIYMEGTRFSEKKRERILHILREKADTETLAQAERCDTVLPPRVAGALAMIDAAPQKDILFFAHTGFEGSADFASLFNGSWMNTTVRLRYWRIKAADIPSDEAGRRTLLKAQWEKMHDEVTAMAAATKQESDQLVASQEILN
ncbi:MAG: 1-acyl-sn-glycerol-3-phosphate acyltransferase [Spongiibacteraceae bacterium]